MKQLIALIAVVVVLGGMMTGCLNVKVPDGPYVNLSENAGSGADKNSDLKEFLKEAQDDGVITKSQYNQLCKRLDKKYGG